MIDGDEARVFRTTVLADGVDSVLESAAYAGATVVSATASESIIMSFRARR
ncbi:Pc21g17320 protein (fragment) [Paenibacillus alvei]|uniref:Pc21g17320 protein n=1 Tax=Paenibacillus alvei TaxID=44250 RepID=A0A383R8S0_PAEAL